MMKKPPVDQNDLRYDQQSSGIFQSPHIKSSNNIRKITTNRPRRRYLFFWFLLICVVLSFISTISLIPRVLPKNLALQPHEQELTKILLTGASGYLGQHLLVAMLSGQRVPAGSNTTRHHIMYATYYHTTEFVEALHQFKESSSSGGVIQLQLDSLDLTNATEIDSYFSLNGPFDVLIHLAALSSPRICESNPEKAIAINVPLYLFSALPANCRIIALSTSHVYTGDKVDPYIEEDATGPHTTYAKSKVLMEQHLLKSGRHVTILRSGNILGPKSPLSPVSLTAFLHFCEDRLRRNEPTMYYGDEYRPIISVNDVIRILLTLLDPNLRSYGIYNMGGPERVSRFEIAQAVSRYLQIPNMNALVLNASKADKPPDSVPSPLDLTMSSSKLEQLVGFPFVGLNETIHETFSDNQ